MFHLFLISFTTASLSHESLCPAPQRQLLVLPASLAILPSAVSSWASGIFSRISQVSLFPCSNTPWFPISLRIHSKVTMLAYTAPLVWSLEAPPAISFLQPYRPHAISLNVFSFPQAQVYLMTFALTAPHVWNVLLPTSLMSHHYFFFYWSRDDLQYYIGFRYTP